MPHEIADSASPNTPELLDVLRGVSSEVLETMFFSQALPLDCEHSWLAAACTARVSFSGSHCGHMRVAVSGEAADSIASGFMGLDPGETPEAERSQVILELANIFCGAILSRVWPESRLQLDAPELTAWADGDELHCCLEMPEGKLALAVRICQTPEPA